MKIVVYLLAFLDASVALPPPSLENEINVYIEPLSNQTLGKPIGGRIIGGYEIKPHSRPYQVAVIINGRSFCAGSLISPFFILTAAHCTVSASYVDLVLGAHNANIQESTQLRVTSTNIIIHEDYTRPDPHSNDISLIKSPNHVVTNNYIQIVDLAQADAGSYDWSVSVLSGWGTTSESGSIISSGLREVYLYILPHSVCFGYYGITYSSICTSGAGILGACTGDSGGPLVIGKVQVGVMSFISSHGCESGYPTGYSRVSYYRDWINRNAGL